MAQMCCGHPCWGDAFSKVILWLVLTGKSLDDAPTTTTTTRCSAWTSMPLLPPPRVHLCICLRTHTGGSAWWRHGRLQRVSTTMTRSICSTLVVVVGTRETDSRRRLCLAFDLWNARHHGWSYAC